MVTPQTAARESCRSHVARVPLCPAAVPAPLFLRPPTYKWLRSRVRLRMINATGVLWREESILTDGS